MARRDFKTATHPANGRKSRRGPLVILVAGMALGVGLTLALTQWLTSKPDAEAPTPTPKTASTKDPAPKPRPQPKPAPVPNESVSPSPKPPAPRVSPAPAPSVAPAPTPAPTLAAPAIKPTPKPANFHDDFVKPKTPTITPPLKPREIWWLQVAALRKEEDARRLRGRLLLHNLDVVITTSDDGSSFRVRVGPYKTEAQALEVEGLLIRNNLTPRRIKEPVFP